MYDRHNFSKSYGFKMKFNKKKDQSDLRTLVCSYVMFDSLRAQYLYRNLRRL